MERADRSSAGLMDILDRVLDKGIVIDASVRVSLVGIDLLGVDAKVTVASIDTYLQLAQDPRAHELGLVISHAPPPARSTRLHPDWVPAEAGGGGGRPSDAEEFGRAAYVEEPPEDPAV